MTGARSMDHATPSHRPRIIEALIETFGFSPLLASIVAAFFLLLGGAAVLWLFLSAPPRSVTIMTGPPGSSFQRNAGLYQQRLAQRGLSVKILPSAGSQENLQQLKNPASGVD